MIEKQLPYCTTNGARLYYEDVGQGFPLVLLHPWPTDHAMWMFQVPVFSERYRVITPDSRGLGKSEKPSGGYSLKQLSDDVNGLLEILGIDRAFIVGNSLGGAAAEKFAIEHPEKVQASVWIGAPTFPADEMLVELDGKNVPFIEVYLRALKSKGYMHFWNTVWKTSMSYQYHEQFVKTYIGSYLIRYLFEERYAKLNSDPRGVIGLLEGLRYEESLDDALSRLDIPCAIVAGDGDDTLPSCEQQHRAIPKAEYFILKNSGHFCYMDQPDVFNDYLDKFLDRHGPVS